MGKFWCFSNGHDIMLCFIEEEIPPEERINVRIREYSGVNNEELDIGSVTMIIV